MDSNSTEIYLQTITFEAGEKKNTTNLIRMFSLVVLLIAFFSIIASIFFTLGMSIAKIDNIDSPFCEKFKIKKSVGCFVNETKEFIIVDTKKCGYSFIGIVFDWLFYTALYIALSCIFLIIFSYFIDYILNKLKQ